MQADKLETVVRDLARTTPQEPGKRSILELRGLGKKSGKVPMRKSTLRIFARSGIKGCSRNISKSY